MVPDDGLLPSNLPRELQGTRAGWSTPEGT